MNLRAAFERVVPRPARRMIKRVLYHPVLHSRFKHLIEYEYIPQGWALTQTDPALKGWNVETILEIYKEKWPAFVRQVAGNRPLGVAHESGLDEGVDILLHNTMVCFAYALLEACRQKQSISMLDWGGGIGHYLLISRNIVPGVDIEYHCKDVPVFVEHGKTLFPEAHFTTDDRCLDRTYDFVLVSGAMHYATDWKQMVRQLAGATGGHLFITRLPTVLRSPSYVFVQRPYSYGYNTEYLGWCLNRDELVSSFAEAGLELVREFVTGEQPNIDRAPEQPMYRGFLLRPRVPGNLPA